MSAKIVDFRPREEARALMLRDERIADELRIVSMLSVQRDLADMYFTREEMHARSWWIDHKMYYAFMLLLQLEFEGEEKEFWKRINAKGKELIVEQEKWDKLHDKK